MSGPTAENIATVVDEDETSRSSFEIDEDFRRSEDLHEAAKLVVEYEWPLDSGNFHFLEEYLANYLGIKGFRRTYKNRVERRRVNTVDEREYLQRHGLITQLQGEMGMIAISSQQVYEVVAPDHEDKFEAYRHMKRRREYREMVEEINWRRSSLTGASAFLGASPVDCEMNSLMKSCAEWNAKLKASVPRNREPASGRAQPYSSARKTGYFPIALLGGQYIDSPRRFSSEELKQFPLNTVLSEPSTSHPSNATSQDLAQKHLKHEKTSLCNQQPKQNNSQDLLMTGDVVVTVPSHPSSVDPEAPSGRHNDNDHDSRNSPLFGIKL